MFEIKNKSLDISGCKTKSSPKRNAYEKPPVMQRLVYNKSQNTLYTNENWKGRHYTDDSKIQKNILVGKGPVYSINGEIENYITNSYGIDQNGISVRFHAGKDNIKKDLFNYCHFNNDYPDYKSKKKFYDQMRTEINGKIQDEYYLYNCYNWSSFAQNSVTCKAVLPPEDLCDSLASSDVNKNWEASLKSKVCVLIAIVKQMEESASHTDSDDYTKKQQFKDQLKSAGFPDTEDLQSKADLYFTNKDSGSLYALIKILHNFIHSNAAHQAYDLDRVNEKLYTDLGYTRIISCNCTFDNLGKCIPQEITLREDRTYIFIISNHAMAVTMLHDLSYTDSPIDPDLYFSPKNDGENFTDTWKDKKVRQVFDKNP